MPDQPDSTRRGHPVTRYAPGTHPPQAGHVEDHKSPLHPDKAADGPAADYVELRCKSNFSFLRGASHPEELVERAAQLGYSALGISDINCLAGVVRMHCAARGCGLRLVVGAEITPDDGPPAGLYPLNRAGYGRLARLITLGRRRAVKGECHIYVTDILEHSTDLVAIVHAADPAFRPTEAERGRGVAGGAFRWPDWRAAFAERLYLGVQAHCGANDRRHLTAMRRLSDRLGVPAVAVNDVHYHLPRRRHLQDVLVCIREGVPLSAAGTRLFANGERYLKSAAEMARRFHPWLEPLRRTREVAERCRFSLDELRYEYPPELCPSGRTAGDYLAELTWAGARQHYGDNIPQKIRGLITHELELIARLAYEHYFLTVWDLVRFARSRGILCQGRGSAANSAVCFCLGITSVDPGRIDVLFERFLSAERNEPPDIDVDFEHERREEVIQYIYTKFGRERAGIAAEVITYRPRSAVREVGKVLGLSLDRVDAIARKVDWWADLGQIEEHLRAVGLDPADHTMCCLMALCREILGFPRHLSQHVGGFIITAGPLCEMVPIENAAMPERTFIEWDKDDIDALGILKVDCLALGMLTALRKAFDLVVDGGEVRGRARWGGRDANARLAAVPAEDPAVYDLACRADTVGVFQIESRAQMSMLPRLKPRCFYDLVIEVAIVRPGPIQGGMVHPYLRRRMGLEPVSFPHPEIAEVLHKTLGVPLFQEQAMRLAVVAAGFTPGEADQLRRAMAAWRRNGSMDRFGTRLIAGMLARGYTREYAELIFSQLRGFGEYGFPESHAASFALLVYVSAWLKRYYPAAFAAALINSQPMGFYAPAQLVRDAREHGVDVRPVDVNFSAYDCTLEGSGNGGSAAAEQRWERTCPPECWGAGGPALRLGLRLVRGISAAGVTGLDAARRAEPFRSVRDLARRSGLPRCVLARLAAADAFRSLGLDRRGALWAVLGLDDAADEALPLLADLEFVEPEAQLPDLRLADHVVADYQTTGLSLKAHPLSLVREQLRGKNVATAAEVRQMAQGRRVCSGGLVLVRQRPSTALGVVFMTLEDETGVVNLAIRPEVYERFRCPARSATALLAWGRIQRQGEVVSVQVEKLAALATFLTELRVESRDFH